MIRHEMVRPVADGATTGPREIIQLGSECLPNTLQTDQLQERFLTRRFLIGPTLASAIAVLIFPEART
jgi:hypothetical protein